MEIPVERDREVELALEWVHHIAGASLVERISAAKAYFLAASVPPRGSMLWPSVMDLVPPNDQTAGLLLQAIALVQDRRYYDARLASRVIPFLKLIGKALALLYRVEGAEQRMREFLNPRNRHPEGSLLELAVAARYLLEGFKLRFIPESQHKTPDIELVLDEGTIEVECKRMRPGELEKKEAETVKNLFDRACHLVDVQSGFKYLDVTFKAPLADVSESYLAEHMSLALSDKDPHYDWSDEFAEGTIRDGNVAALRGDSNNGALLVGPKLFRLFTNMVVPSQRVLLGARGERHEVDPRYLESFGAVALCSWDTVNDESMRARARHFGSKLAEIDSQLQGCTLGAAHIVLDAERDSRTADLRRERIRDKLRSFNFTSRLAVLTTHYLLTHTAESKAWTLDETADLASRTLRLLLDDPRLFPYGEVMGEEPAWHLTPPR